MPAMVTVFERIPELFVNVYDGQFRAWARDFKKVGKRATIRFRKPLEPSALAMDRRRVVGVVLLAEVDGNRVVVRPSNGEAEEVIRRHTRELAAEVLN